MPDQALAPSSILIIDDDPLLRMIAESYFRAKGSDVVRTAEDGVVALEILDSLEISPGLILCDLNMPNIDGLQFLRLLKQRDYKEPIIILSSEHLSIITMAEKLARTHDLNIIAALSKPLKPIEIDNVLLKLKKPVASRLKKTSHNLTENELRSAISSGNILPYYQPKADTQTGRTVGVEALARWIHPEIGVILPDDFIPLAEQTGLIKPLTKTIIHQAITDAERLARLRLNIKMAINLSVLMLDDVVLPDEIAFLIDEADLDPSMFTFEITESGIVEKNAMSIEVLARLRMLRFGLSIDDFGTAYSNLEHLLQFPFTELKIDRMFVSNALTDPKAMASVETSVSLAQKLGLTIVAEGVETKEDWKYLSKLGVDELQGFLFARPMPIKELLNYIFDWQAGQVSDHRHQA